MTQEESSIRSQLEAALQFETMIAELSSHFVNLPAGEVDREIMDAERRLCELLGLDIAALWQLSDEAPDFYTVTHYYSVHEGPQPPGRVKVEDFPWFRQQLQAGRTVAISSLEELPAEAARDQEVCRQLGIKSNLTIPLSVGGERPFGILGLNTTQVERDWTDAMVKRLQLLAQIFANALARKRADQALRESKALLEAGADLAGLGCYEVNFDERFCYIDDRFHEICGVPAGRQHSLLPVQLWMNQIHPDDRQRVLDERDQLHGARIERIAIEYRYLHPTQGEKWIHHVARVAARDVSGRAVRTFGVVRDITQQKRAELEAQELRSSLMHTGRVTVLGQLATALAHELSQPLGAILRNAEAAEIMLQGASPDLEELRAIVTDILSDDERASRVIDRLRSLLQRRTLDPQPIELPDVIAEVLTLVHSDAVTRHVKLACAIAPDLRPIWGDRIHLQQVLLNLLVNAMDAIEGCAPNRRSVQVSACRTDPATVEVRICDDGPGIPGEYLARLFEPFFTTKSNGMGIGLAVSKTIIEAHQGKLWAENRPEGGACFCFTVPVADVGGAP